MPNQIAGWLEQMAMSRTQAWLLQRLRSITVVLMIVVAGTVSFAGVSARAAHASVAEVRAIVAPSRTANGPAGICHRMLLPGAANPCPLAGFSFGAIVGDAQRVSFFPRCNAAVWRLFDASLPAQCSALGLYRPPRLPA